MSISNELAVIAQIGISFSGFLSIFLVFASRDGRFSPADSIAVLNILATGFGVVFSALAPLLLHRLGIPNELLWRLSGGIALCSAVPLSIYLVRRERQVRKADELTSMATGQRLVGQGLGLVNLAMFAALALGFFGSLAPGVYLLTLVTALAIGTSSFLALALARMQ